MKCSVMECQHVPCVNAIVLQGDCCPRCASGKHPAPIIIFVMNELHQKSTLFDEKCWVITLQI